jgi:hypothetical protein
VEYRTSIYVDENQNIVTRIETIETPQEYLTRNGQVYNFAEAMKPGARLTTTKQQGITHEN